MVNTRICLVVGIALALGGLLAVGLSGARLAHASEFPSDATPTPYMFPTPVPGVWSTPIIALPTFEPFTFGLTDTRVYSGFWTYEKWWGTLGLVQKGYLLLNDYHIINLAVVFLIASVCVVLIVKLVKNKIFGGK